MLLGGNSPLICLSCVGLLVPLHLVLWKLGTWFTTGVALRGPRPLGVILFIFQAIGLLQMSHSRAEQIAAAAKHLLFFSPGCIFQVLCGCIPVVSFIMVRWLDAIDSEDLNIALWVHAFVCCLGVFVILLQPCENGD